MKVGGIPLLHLDHSATDTKNFVIVGTEAQLTHLLGHYVHGVLLLKYIIVRLDLYFVFSQTVLVTHKKKTDCR